MLDAILFVQLGSPEEATPESVKKYLVEFLGDWHTLGNPPFFWNALLKFIIAPRRSAKSAEKYRLMVENSGLGEMPLIYYTRRFSEEAAKIIGQEIPVRHAFEFGARPSIGDVLEEFNRLGKREICVVPLYPQRSLVTTVAVRDLAQDAFRRFPSQKMRFVEGFPMNRVWLEETLNNILLHWDKKCPVVFSFHGIPEKWERLGDPYRSDCERAFEWFQGKLKEVSAEAKTYKAYQSRFGKGKWLGPSAKEVLEDLGMRHEDVLVVCPSFTADNLETLYEADVELNALFKSAGGGRFVRIPCLNLNESWIRRFAEEILRISQMETR